MLLPNITKSAAAAGAPFIFLLSMVALGAVAAPALAEPQTCAGVEVDIVSIKKTGPGDVTALFTLKNTSNEDRAMFTYSSGANGRNTFLIDNSGVEWDRKKLDGNGNHRQPLLMGVKANYALIFHLAEGGQDAKSFTAQFYPQILPLSGRGEVGWCDLKFRDVPLS